MNLSISKPAPSALPAKVKWLLAVILLMAALLRFYGLDVQSLYNDELSSWDQSHQASLATVLQRGVIPDVHPPAYQVFLFWVEQYWGDTETILRFPSAVSGVLAVWVIFLIGLELYSYKEGLIAALLTAILHAPIYYSQEARSYSMLLLAGSAASLFWIRILKSWLTGKSFSWPHTLAYILSAILTCYLHYFGLLLISFQGCWGLLRIRTSRQFVSWLGAYAVIAAAFLPWLPVMADQYQLHPVSYIDRTPHIMKSFTQLIHFFFNNSWAPASNETYRWVLMMYAAWLFQWLCSVIRHRKSQSADEGAPFASSLLTAWLIIPFVVAHLKSVLSSPILTDRNMMITLPAAYLLLARAMIRLIKNIRGQIAVTALITIYALYCLIVRMDYYSKPTKPQVREAVRVVLNLSNRYPNSLVMGYACEYEHLDYYFIRHASQLRVKLMAGSARDIAKTEILLQQTRPEYVWYITSHIVPEPAFLQYLKNRMTLIQERQWPERISVRLYQNQPADQRLNRSTKDR